MTFQEILYACGQGYMPRVKVEKPLSPNASRYGEVIGIKNGDGFEGVIVNFPGMSCNTWFHAEDGTDKRKKYMKDLTLIE